MLHSSGCTIVHAHAAVLARERPLVDPSLCKAPWRYRTTERQIVEHSKVGISTCHCEALHCWMKDWPTLLGGSQRHWPASFEWVHNSARAQPHCWQEWRALLGGDDRLASTAVCWAEALPLFTEWRCPPPLERASHWSRRGNAALPDEWLGQQLLRRSLDIVSSTQLTRLSG